MMAFTEMRHRQTSIFGTRGELTGDGRMIKHYDFLTDSTTVIDTEADEASILAGHGGGDFGLMESFIQTVAHNDAAYNLSDPDVSLESHLMVFAAEQARRESRVVQLT